MTASDEMQESPIAEPESPESDCSTILYKIKANPTYSTLHCLEELLNKVGLTLQTTTKNRMILCKIVDSKPCCDNVVDDFVFVGSDNKEGEISERMLDCIENFIVNAATGPATILGTQRKWQHGARTYGKIIVVNEDVNSIAQGMVLS